MSEIRERLIQHAIDTIRKSGIHKLTMRDLGKAVDIKASSVMYHFKSKDSLMAELVKTYSEEFFIYLDEINKTTADAKDRINKLIDLYEASLRDEKLCLCGMIASDSYNLDDNTKTLVKEFFIYLEKWIEENLVLLKKDKKLAQLILASLNGAMIIDNLNEHKINYISSIRLILNN